jgi:hypothetical protein
MWNKSEQVPINLSYCTEANTRPPVTLDSWVVERRQYRDSLPSFCLIHIRRLRLQELSDWHSPSQITKTVWLTFAVSDYENCLIDIPRLRLRELSDSHSPSQITRTVDMPYYSELGRTVVCITVGPRQRGETWFPVPSRPIARFSRFLLDFKWGYTFGGMMLWLLLVTPPLPESDSWLSRSNFHSVSLSHSSRVPI